MVQPARNDFALLVDETLMAVHAASVPDQLDRDTARVLNAQMGNIHQLAAAERLVRVANIARHLLRLLAAIDAEGPNDRHAATA